MQMGTCWRDAILFGNLDAALKDLIALEEATVGEPRNYPYKQAADDLFRLMDTLHTQLTNAAKNAYYTKKRQVDSDWQQTRDAGKARDDS